MAIPQRALNLSLAAMRRLNSAWGRLTTLRKAIVVGMAVFMLGLPLDFRQAAMYAAAEQEVRIERNKVRIGMTINDLLPLVHGMEITAEAEGAWLSVLPDNKHFYYSPDLLSLVQHDDGTFTFRCFCQEQVSRNEKLTESQAAELTMPKTVQVLQNLTASQAAELMKQRMSGGFDWSWQYTSPFKGSRQYFFNVTFGRDGQVNNITEVYFTDLSTHRP